MARIDGTAVRDLREKRGESATRFAARVGIKLKYLSDIECGRRSLARNPALIIRIAEALGVELDQVRRTDEPVEASA